MAAKTLPPQELLRQLLSYNAATGRLFWLHRTEAMFSPRDARGPAWAANAWNKRYSGTEAFTSSDRRGYRHGKVGGECYQAHRIVWKLVTGVDPDMIDHVNCNPSDNRMENLRSCSNAENSRNYAKTGKSSSRFRGVCWATRDRKWIASISVSSRKIVAGRFDDESMAAKAYDALALLHHGAFAVINFPAAQSDHDARIRAALEE